MKICIVLPLFLTMAVAYPRKNSLIPDENLAWDCKGVHYVNVTLTAYYPSYSKYERHRGNLDSRGKKLRTLQDFLDKRADYVTLAMDEKLKIPYGTPACSPELNRYFRRRIRLQVRDDGTNLVGMGYSRADICVKSERESYDDVVNGIVTLVF